MRNTFLHLLFILIAIAVLLAELFSNESVTFIAKPLIMVWILIYYIWNVGRGQIKIKVILAFIAAWLGDVLLMFQSQGELFFILGLGSFLVCQLLYASIFFENVFKDGIQSNWLFKEPIWVILLLLYLGTLYTVMYPGLNETLKLPVFVYALSITFMSITALSRRDVVARGNFQLVVVGALLFVLSDSFIGINKFTFEIPYAGFWILLTYMAAQYFIVRGLIFKISDV